MLSDVSSLTEISSDDEAAFVPSKAKKTSAKGKPWALKGVLKAPRTVQFSAKHLYEEILEGKIDLDPEYQRAVVWPDPKQINLIDSMLRNFYIPPVIFAVSVSDDGEERRTCIDGKQRLTSIQRFMDGMIPYKDPRSNVKMWYKHRATVSGKLLPQQYRSQFASKQIICMEYEGITDDAEREIFQRVQLGVALTPAERMQAISGPWSQLVREILAVMDEYGMGEELDWSSSRGRGFQCVTSSIYLMEKATSSNPSAPVLDKWLQRVTPPTKAFKERVVDVFAVFRHLVVTKKYFSTFQKPTRISPIEFIMCTILIDNFMNTLSLPQLAAAITKMREDVRSKHADIRANSKVMKTMHQFIFDRFPSNLKKVDPTEKPALKVVKSDTSSPLANRNGKRKRNSDDNSENSSDDNEPLRPKSPPIKKSIRASSGDAGAPVLKSSSSSQDRLPTSSKSTWPDSSKGKSTGSQPSSRDEAAATLKQPIKTDRLAKLREKKASLSIPKQTPTPPPTGGSVVALPRAPSRQGSNMPPPPPPGSAAQPQSFAESSVGNGAPASPLAGVDMDEVQRILAQTNVKQASMGGQQTQWPNQSTGSGTGSPRAQMRSPTLGQDPPGINTIHHGQQAGGVANADPRLNPSRQGSYSTPNSGTDGSGVYPQNPQHVHQQGFRPQTPIAIPSQVTTSTPMRSPGGPRTPVGLPPRPSPAFSPRIDNERNGSIPPRHRDRDTRFDRSSSLASSMGYVSPRQPPLEPRGAGPNSWPRTLPAQSLTGPYDRDRDTVLNGSINGRERDSGWASRSGGSTGGSNGR